MKIIFVLIITGLNQKDEIKPVQKPLLRFDEPEPIAWTNRWSTSSIFLVCEHAGELIPSALHELSQSALTLDRHRRTDIGAEQLARGIAEKLQAPLVLQRYSRLVIDCNRPPGTPESVPRHLDSVTVSGNQHADSQDRVDEIFMPFSTAIEAGLDCHPRQIALSVHSFAPRLSTGAERPWHCGFLARQDMQTAQRLMQAVAEQAPALNLALNEPYQIEDDSDWFIPAQAEPRGLAHALIEVRNDQLSDKAGIARWVDLLANAILKLPEIHA